MIELSEQLAIIDPAKSFIHRVACVNLGTALQAIHWAAVFILSFCRMAKGMELYVIELTLIVRSPFSFKRLISQV